MVELLERHGGFVDAGTAGYLGLTERLRQLFDDEAAGRLQEGIVPPGRTVADELLFSAAASGNVELVEMALEHLEWPRGDARWQGRLMQSFGCHPEAERQRYLTCFRMILHRSGVDLPSGLRRTLLHDVAGPGRARRRWEQRSASASQRSSWTPARSSMCATICSTARRSDGHAGGAVQSWSRFCWSVAQIQWRLMPSRGRRHWRGRKR